MGTYAEGGLADFESGPLLGETAGTRFFGSLWIEKKERLKALERHQADGALTLQDVGRWKSYW